MKFLVDVYQCGDSISVGVKDMSSLVNPVERCFGEMLLSSTLQGRLSVPMGGCQSEL